MKAKMPTQRAMPQKSGASAVLKASGMVTSAATEPKTVARKILPKAALSPPAAKKRPHEMKAVGRIRWKFSGRPNAPAPVRSSCTVTQWNVKFRESSVQRNDRTPDDDRQRRDRLCACAHPGVDSFMRRTGDAPTGMKRGSVAARHATGPGRARRRDGRSLRPPDCSWQPLQVLFSSAPVRERCSARENLPRPMRGGGGGADAGRRPATMPHEDLAARASGRVADHRAGPPPGRRATTPTPMASSARASIADRLLSLRGVGRRDVGSSGPSCTTTRSTRPRDGLEHALRGGRRRRSRRSRPAGS